MIIRLVQAILIALAVTGLMTIIEDSSAALKKHYEVKCVDDNADDYGFTIPQIKASATPRVAVYGETL